MCNLPFPHVQFSRLWHQSCRRLLTFQMNMLLLTLGLKCEGWRINCVTSDSGHLNPWDGDRRCSPVWVTTGQPNQILIQQKTSTLKTLKTMVSLHEITWCHNPDHNLNIHQFKTAKTECTAAMCGKILNDNKIGKCKKVVRNGILCDSCN
jgi:hypothetical protein